MSLEFLGIGDGSKHTLHTSAFLGNVGDEVLVLIDCYDDTFSLLKEGLMLEDRSEITILLTNVKSIDAICELILYIHNISETKIQIIYPDIYKLYGLIRERGICVPCTLLEPHEYVTNNSFKIKQFEPVQLLDGGTAYAYLIEECGNYTIYNSEGKIPESFLSLLNNHTISYWYQGVSQQCDALTSKMTLSELQDYACKYYVATRCSIFCINSQMGVFPNPYRLGYGLQIPYKTSMSYYADRVRERRYKEHYDTALNAYTESFIGPRLNLNKAYDVYKAQPRIAHKCNVNHFSECNTQDLHRWVSFNYRIHKQQRKVIDYLEQRTCLNAGDITWFIVAPLLYVFNKDTKGKLHEDALTNCTRPTGFQSKQPYYHYFTSHCLCSDDFQSARVARCTRYEIAVISAYDKEYVESYKTIPTLLLYTFINRIMDKNNDEYWCKEANDIGLSDDTVLRRFDNYLHVTGYNKLLPYNLTKEQEVYRFNIEHGGRGFKRLMEDNTYPRNRDIPVPANFFERKIAYPKFLTDERILFCLGKEPEVYDGYLRKKAKEYDRLLSQEKAAKKKLLEQQEHKSFNAIDAFFQEHWSTIGIRNSGFKKEI